MREMCSPDAQEITLGVQYDGTHCVGLNRGLHTRFSKRLFKKTVNPFHVMCLTACATTLSSLTV